MGDVHEAWDVVLCRTVALKVLKDIEPAALIRFMHEAQIHARVGHPNICRIYDVDNHEGSLRVAMQLVRGPNLEQACRELTVQEVVTIMALVAQAVHLVHRLNLIHRDLKPSNILLERNAEGQWVPYVCDFGLALALDEQPLTLSHGVLGTPAYMAPEQFQGERSRITAATDVFALGGTLHYALTGRPPTGSFSVKSVPAGDPAIPRDLRLIIAKCLEPDPVHRYPTAAVLGEDLWRYLEGSPIRASARNRVNRFGTWTRKELRLAKPYLVALGAVALAGSGWLVHMAYVNGEIRRQAGLAQQLILEAEEQAAAFRLERTLPIHDLRPTYARIRGRLEAAQARIPSLSPEWRGQGLFAVGSARLWLGDGAGARAALEQAWAAGFRSPRVAELLARAVIVESRAADEAAQFDSGLQRQAPGAAAVNAEACLLQGRDPDTGPRTDALAACLRDDYQRAAGASHAESLASPWRFEAAQMETESLTALARRHLEEGALAPARARLQEAVAAARAALQVGRSDPDLYHAYFQATRQLAALDREGGRLDPATLDGLQTACSQALGLDPADPRLQDDWLGLRWLKAMCLADLGRDPEPDLAAALDFMGTWTREPLTPALRADRMLVFWQLAELDFSRGRDLGPNLTEALRSSGHTPFLERDYEWDVLNLKARTEAARGADPRPTVDAALEQFKPLLQQGSTWPLKEAAAEAWLIRAEWEAAHGLDPGRSIQNARSSAESARSQVPDSASAHALEGLTQVQEMLAFPRERARLLPLARESLRLALALAPRGRRQTLLQRALLGAAPRVVQ
jgi:serine/threonine-protein kinase